MLPPSDWLGLVVGNSRLHWGWFSAAGLQQAWDTPHLAEAAIARLIGHQFDSERCPDLGSPIKIPPAPRLRFASVVPAQAALWQQYARVEAVTLADVPLTGVYPTLGIDRALAAWGAVQVYRAPALAIDGGTALTFTGVNDRAELVGGAILPGLQLQLRSLAQNTAALPAVASQSGLPLRWARTTPEAIQSGVLYTLLAGVRDFTQSWLQQFSDSAVVLTGGDGAALHAHLQQIDPLLAQRIAIDPHLVLRGMQYSIKPAL